VSPNDVVVVLVGAPSEDVAERIAAAVVPEHLAAAVNILPGVRSIFFWQGRVETASEVLLMIKTRADRLPALERRVRDLHPYTVPGFVALPVAAGHAPYLAWISDSVTTKGGGTADQE
jgi:periplasmic divalent cation tolerance protein